jgi:hypothetical protein
MNQQVNWIENWYSHHVKWVQSFENSVVFRDRVVFLYSSCACFFLPPPVWYPPPPESYEAGQTLRGPSLLPHVMKPRIGLGEGKHNGLE